MEKTGLKSDKLHEAWRKFKGGDFASLGLLFETHYQELYFYGIKLVALPEMVKDTIQDIFADVWQRRSKMTTVENFKAYLIISLRRELIRRIVRTRKEMTAEFPVNMQFSFSVEDFMIDHENNQERSKILARSLEGLTERQREVILLRFFHGLEFVEIAKALGMNIQSVRNLLFRALEKIRKDMQNQGISGVENVEMFLWTVFSKKL